MIGVHSPTRTLSRRVSLRPPNEEDSMRRTMIALAALAAFALPAGSAMAKTVTFKATSKVTHAQIVDNGATGDSPGDLLVFTEDLFNARGKKIGTDAASCVRLFDPTSICTGVFKLRGGHVMVQLIQPGPSGTYDQAVTGGTGRFEGARGRVRVAQSPPGDRFTFKLRL